MAPDRYADKWTETIRRFAIADALGVVRRGLLPLVPDQFPACIERDRHRPLPTSQDVLDVSRAEADRDPEGATFYGGRFRQDFVARP